MELTVKTAEKTDFNLIKTNLVNEFIKYESMPKQILQIAKI